MDFVINIRTRTKKIPWNSVKIGCISERMKKERSKNKKKK